MDERLYFKISKYITSLIFAICLAYIISYTFFAQSIQQGYSMTPYINDRALVLSCRLYHSILQLKKYDVIVFYAGNVESIKRIYGVPGDTIVVSGGNLYINDVLDDNEALKNSLSSNIDQHVVLGPGEYYVLGDNLDSSKDSRFQDIGNINRNDIIGKVWHIFKR